MRPAFVSVALLALAYSLAPGVHGAPAVVSDHTNSLAVRQDPSAIITALVGSLIGTIESLVGSTTSIPPPVAGQLEQIAQKLQKSAASGVVPRGPSSDSTSSTTTSQVSPVATVQTGISTVSSVSSASLGTPQASVTPPTRMRRQLPSALPTSVLPNMLSVLGSKSAALPVQSVVAAPSKLGSTTSSSAASKPTPSNPGATTRQV